MKRALLVGLIVSGASFAASPVRADLLPMGQTMVPIELTLKGLDQMKDTTIVVNGCSDKTGRHAFQFAKSGEPVTCHTVKRGVEFFAVANKDKKPLEALYAKDLGWGSERGEADKLLEKAKSCGKGDISGFVLESMNITKLAQTYEFQASTGCSVKAVGALTEIKSAANPAASASATPSASAAPPPAPSASASAAPVTAKSAAPASSAPAAPAKSGCAVHGAASPRELGGFAAIALAVGVVLRRRPRRDDARRP